MEKRKQIRTIFYIGSILFFFCYFILNKYHMILNVSYTSITAFLLYILYPPMKERKKYLMDHFRQMSSTLFLYLFFYFFLGLLLGYQKNPFSLSIMNFIFVIVMIFMQEYIRGKLLIQSTSTNRVQIALLFTLLTALPFIKVNEPILLISIFIIHLFMNILCTYVTYQISYKLSVFYRNFVVILFYLIPIMPKLSIIFIIITFSILSIIIINQIFTYSSYKRYLFRKYHLLSFYPILMILFLILSLVFGIFRYQIIGIASNSMVPIFKRGDSVIYDKGEKQINVGDIIVFKKSESVVVHRVVATRKKDKEEYYVTKGDNNKKNDSKLVSKKDILGVVTCDIPYLGYPSIWIKKK